jgi:RNA polymerase-binding transcription factor DksA
MQPKHIRQRLDEERERLLRVREGLGSGGGGDAGASVADELSHYDQHPGDLGSETFEQEKNASLLEQVDAELDAIDQALQRLEAGRYGTCLACGRPIADERLEAMPAARFCVEDQARAEREAGASGRRW